MSKLTKALPRIGYITKEVIKQFFRDAKLYPIDAILCIIILILLVWYIFDDIWLEGSAAILFAYTWLNVRRLATMHRKIDELKKMVNPTNTTMP